MNTTLNEIKSHDPCESGWKKLLKSLNKTCSDDEPISLKFILESNGIKDAIWALRCFDCSDHCLFLADVAESVLDVYEKNHDNPAPRNAIIAIRDYKTGGITKEKLRVAAVTAAYAADDASATSAAYAAATSAAYAASATTDRAAAAAADHAAAAAASAADSTTTAADARKNKWNEIEQLFIKYFCKESNND